jgi:streptogramin lyase
VASIEVEGASEVVAGEGGVWVTTDKGTVVAIEPGSDAIVDEVKVGPPPRSETYRPVTNCCHPGAGLVVDDGSVWVVSTGDEKLVEIDAVTHEVTSRIPIPGKPLDVTAAAGSLWVSVR